MRQPTLAPPVPLLVHHGMLPAGLSLAERHGLAMDTIESPRVKLECLLFKAQFPADIAGVQDQMSTLCSAISEVRNSEALARFLQAILHLGNYLNDGSSAPAAGFRLVSSINQLATVRATDNSTNMLKVMVSMMARSHPGVFAALSAELPTTPSAVKLSVEEMQREIATLSEGLARMRTEAERRERGGAVPRQTLRKLVQIGKQTLGQQCADLPSCALDCATAGLTARVCRMDIEQDNNQEPSETVRIQVAVAGSAGPDCGRGSGMRTAPSGVRRGDGPRPGPTALGAAGREQALCGDAALPRRSAARRASGSGWAEATAAASARGKRARKRTRTAAASATATASAEDGAWRRAESDIGTAGSGATVASLASEGGAGSEDGRFVHAPRAQGPPPPTPPEFFGALHKCVRRPDSCKLQV